jgi:DNA-directed RNA polymerase subunit RPC12/RpoP
MLADVLEISLERKNVMELQPALEQLGVTRCPICRREVAVFLTKSKRPFVNCSFCSVRIFYNGAESMRRLKKRMYPAEEE